MIRASPRWCLALALVGCARPSSDGTNDEGDDEGLLEFCQPGSVEPQAPATAQAIWQADINCVQAAGIGDVDGDGVPDVVYATNFCAGDSDSKDELEIEFGAAAGPTLGHFGPTALAHDAFGTRMAVADVDADGRAEILSAGSGGVQLGRMQDLATYGSTNVVVEPQTYIVVDDLDHDEALDLLIGTAAAESRVHWGDGSGAFVEGSDLEGRIGRGLAGDFDEDGIGDVALLGLTLQIMAGEGQREFALLTEHETAGAGTMSVGDFDCDGLDDIVLMGGSEGTELLRATGAGQFASSSLADLELSGGSMVSADFNGDGALDFAASAVVGLTLALGDGEGGFPERFDLGPAPQPSPVLARDTLGDLRPELLVAADTELRVLGFD